MWCRWAALAGWTEPVLLALLIGTVTLVGIGYQCRSPYQVGQYLGPAEVPVPSGDRRAQMEAARRRATHGSGTITRADLEAVLGRS